MTTTECVKIVEYLQKNHPSIIEDAEQQIKKPDAYIDYFYVLPELLDSFCQKKGFTKDYIKGKDKGTQHVWDRTIFIAIVFKLYTPEVFNQSVTYDLKNNIRHELSGMLDCHPTWISNAIGKIIQFMQVYDEFRDQVNEFVASAHDEIIIKKPVEENKIELFQ